MLSTSYVIILIPKNEGYKMKFTKRENHTELQRNIEKQINSLFIGAVVNETSLEDYAFTKELISYNSGYPIHQLCLMQKNMNIVKYDFPNIYASYRSELLSQIQGRNISSIFTICDKYIYSFATLRLFNYNEVNNSFRSFSSRLIT